MGRVLQEKLIAKRIDFDIQANMRKNYSRHLELMNGAHRICKGCKALPMVLFFYQLFSTE